MGSIEFDRASKKMIYHPSAKDILLSLAEMPQWCRILHEQTTAPYKDFLRIIITKNFFENEDRLIIGKIAKEAGIDQAKLKKWLIQMYEDLLDLNYEKPELFKSPGIKHTLCFNYFRNACLLNVWLPSTPRKYETIQMYFVNAKLNCSTFTVTNITHVIKETQASIMLHLDGGITNIYRDWLYERALFEREIGYMQDFESTDSEIDDLLRKLYK